MKSFAAMALVLTVLLTSRLRMIAAHIECDQGSSPASQEYTEDVANLLKMLQTSTPDAEGHRLSIDMVRSHVKTVVGIATCSPIITTAFCSACLAGVADAIRVQCGNSMGANVITPGCSIRYYPPTQT